MEGRTVLITGGSRGIGRAISLRFAKAEAQVFINFFQNRTAAEKTAQDVESLGARVYLHQADLQDEEQIRGMFNEVQRQFGGLDVLVHSAAAGVLRPVTELSGKHWDWVMNTNARSLLLCAREGGAMMREGGRIISLSSLGSGRVIPQYSSIGVSKAALESLTRYLAVEFAPRGISVNTVSAGAVSTEVWDLVPDGQEILAKVINRTPSGRLPTPGEIAEIVFFLSSPHAQMIQGQVIVVDGGYSLLA